MRFRRIPYQIPYCTCEHSQLTHLPTEYGIEFHGRCVVHGCFCQKFTWTNKFHIVKRDADNQDLLVIGKKVTEPNSELREGVYQY